MGVSVKRNERTGKWTYTVNLPRTTEGKRPQYERTGFDKRSQAVAAEAAFRATLRGGQPVGSGRLSLGGYLTGWLAAVDADPRLKPATKAHYRRMSVHLVRGVGHIRLDQFTGQDLTVLYGQLRAKGLSESTVRHVHVTARKALGAAKRMLPYNPADDATTPAQPRGKPQAFTPEEVSRFLAMAAEDRWAPLWRLAAMSAKRRGELAALHWSDLDLDAGVWTVSRNCVVVDHQVVEGTTKSDRVDRITLDAATVAALRAWRVRQLEERLACGAEWPGDLVWTWQDGQRLHPDTITRAFARLRNRAGLPGLSIHHLRHSWATIALAKGVSVKTVSDRLAHSSVRVTLDLYTQATPEQDAAATAMMADVYDQAVDTSH